MLPRRCTPSLHGIYAVAELKRRAEAPPYPDVRRLHGIYAVAELKPSRFDEAASATHGLHGIYAVAELKPSRIRARPRASVEVSTASMPWPN